MYKYRNKDTGVEFLTPCECSGDSWELVEAPADREAEDKGTKEKKGRKK